MENLKVSSHNKLIQIREKNIFFVLSTGRSGTQTIARSLSELPDCVCLHEPAPQLILESSAYRYGRLDGKKLKQFILQTRCPVFNGKLYGESNQTLSLITPILAASFPKAKFIWMIRNGLDVVSSIFSRQWYTGHSANHSRYEDCPPIEKAWIDGRIMGDLCGDVPFAKWKSMNPFARCCWYWAYINLTIEKDLSDICSAGSYRKIKLEELDRDLPELVEWLGFGQAPDLKSGNYNRAHYNLYPWQKWTSEERKTFLYWCGPLMDRLYLDWRTLNREFFNTLDDAPKSIKVPVENNLKNQINLQDDNYSKAKLEEFNICFTPQLKTHPKISVYVTSYNQKKYLVETIESVLAQTLNPHQVIIVDDFSNDGSQELIAKYAHKYPNLVFPIYHMKNFGVVQTRIDALNAVTGDFVTYVDGDDRFLPEKIEREFDILAGNTNAQIAYSNNYYINPEGQRTGVWAEKEKPPEGNVFKETFSRCFPKSSLFRMELVNYQAWKSVGFHDPDITICEDFDMRIRLTKHFQVAFCDEPLSEIRLHDKGLSKLKAKQHLASLEFIYHKNKSLLSDINESDHEIVKKGFNDFVNKISLSAANQLAEDRKIKKQYSDKLSHEMISASSKKDQPQRLNELGANLIFLISQPRAGSTLFQRLLAGHPEVHTTAEPWLMLHPLYALKENGIKAEYRADLAQQGLADFLMQVPEGIELYKRALRKFGSTLYNRILESSGKRFFLDKTPRYYHIIPELFSIFPEANFIFLLRNPIAVLSSVLKTWFGNCVDDLQIENLIDLVKGPVCLLDGIKKLKEKAIVVEYESLVKSPEKMMLRVCNRIGIPYYGDILEYGRNPKPKGEFGDPVGIYKHNRPVTDNIDKWQNNIFSPEFVEISNQYLEILGSDIVSKMGYNFKELKQKLNSQSRFSNTLKTKFNEVEALNKKGENLFAKGEFDAALTKFQKAYNFDPNDAETNNNLGVIYYRKGDKENALIHYKIATQLMPNNINFQKNLADFYYVEMGRVEEAVEIYVKVLRTNPEDIEILLVLAHICVTLEKFDDAKDFYNRIIKIDPGNKDAREFLEKVEKFQLSIAGGQTDQVDNEADSNGILVSAIVSTYNAERFIRGCLEDLENQTIADRLEIVVVNSGSQQSEEIVIREFQEKFSNIKSIKTDQRETVYAAWNRGIQAATGKYITNANTDDRHRKDSLEVMVNILETLPEISLVYADVIITETENEKFDNCKPVGYFNWMNFSREDLLNKGCFVGPQPMWRRDVHHEYGYFDDSFVSSGDYEFWLRISQSCTFMHLPVRLGLYLRSPGSIEHSNREKQREENNKIFKMYKYAQSSGKIIRRIKTCLSQDHTKQSSENIKSPEEIYQNILAAMGNKQPDETIGELEKLSASFPEFALVHNDLGVLYYNDGDKEKALNFYQKAVQLEPANAIFQRNLADYYLVELDRKEEALQIYLSLLNHHPNDLETNLTSAHICVAVQNYSKAKILYKQVLVIDPDNEDARNNLRMLDKIKGDLRTDEQPNTESLQKSTSEEYSPAKETNGVNDSPEKDIPQYSIIILTAAPLKLIRRCVEGIKKHTSESHEIVFVNNGTTKGVLKWVRKCIDENHNCRLVKCGKGANPAVCYNTGIKAARGEYIVLLANDVGVTDGWLSIMLQCFSSIPNTGMVGTMANRAKGRQKVAAAVNPSLTEINAFAESYRATNRYRRIECDILDGFCLIFRRDLTKKIGLFDEQISVLGFEDEDYCIRAALEGYVNQIAGDVYLHRLEQKEFVRSKKNFYLKWSGTDVQSPTGKRHLALRAVEKANRAGEEGKIDLAVELYLQAIGLLPELKECYYKLAEMLVNTKRFQDALDVLNELPEGDPDAKHLELTACCKEGLESLEEAQGYADQALEIDRCSKSALNTKGIIAFRRDDKNTAESYFVRAMETDPGFGEAYTNLGALKWAAGLKDEALGLYERGFILSPTVADIALNYHCALADLCEYQRAESVVRDAAAVHPHNKKVRYMLIDILIHQRNDEMAMQEIETAIADFGLDDGILPSALKIRERIGPLTIDKKTACDSTVSLCMIVKDEEDHLARCLQSVRPVVDEMIIVDTGSKDRCRDIARVFGAKVFDFKWTEDFAEARNYSLSKATGKMVFVMDADEVISPLDYKLFRQTARQSSRERSAAIINTRNYTRDNNLVEWVANEGYYDIEEAGTGWTPSAKIRLFPNDPHIRFDFPVHEMVEPALQKMGIPVKLCKFQVHHYGKLNRDKSERKGEAYYEIGCKKLEEMGDSPIALRELAIQAEGLKKHQEAVELWERYIAIVPNEPKAYINMGISYCNLGQFDKVLVTAEKALKFAPDSKEGYYNCALAKLHLGHLDQSIEILEELCEEMPEYLPARFILAAACCCREDKKRGMALLKELSGTAIGPGLAIRCHELARRFVSLQRPAYALALLDAAIDSQNANKDVLDLYADCLKRTDFHKKTGTYE